MTWEEMLKEAAKNSCLSHAAAWENEISADFSVTHTKSFEKRIRAAARRSKHPAVPQTFMRAASFFLAVLLAGAVWLSVDTKAREAFFGWVREVYYSTFVYRFWGETAEANAAPADYRLGWVPDGYEEVTLRKTQSFVFVVYRNADGDLLEFTYTTNNTDPALQIPAASTVHEVMIKGLPASYLTYEDAAIAPGLIWTSEDGSVGFSLTGFFDEKTLIAMAESVFDDASSSPAEEICFTMGSIPDGYAKLKEGTTQTTGYEIYSNQRGQRLRLTYSLPGTETSWSIHSPDSSIISAAVAGQPAEILIPDDPASAPSIVWASNETDTGFLISGFFSAEELIRLAESVKISK